MFDGKILMITGGTGSFGNAVLRRYLNTNIKEIRIFSRDEKKQDDMRNLYKNNKIKFYLGDVRDYSGIESALEGVDYIFHAAALKQVPSSEFFPMEATRTNILGTENVLTAAIKQNVKKIICLSTDKAVYPINAMGISKAMMEKLMVAKSRITEKTTFLGTRYGNVMASRGSVIPLFISQIKQGSPITITDPNMTRFMMSLENAVELVLFAFENGKNGDRFVQKAPAATIGQLVDALKIIFNADNEIKIIGTRHGEKLYETLLSREECLVAEDLGNYFRISPDDRDLNYSKYISEGDGKISEIDEYNSHNTNRLKINELIDLLISLDYVKNELINWNGSVIDTKETVQKVKL
jgi:UDP-N-acetylglucosamine 4,6-dehydratase/5-epimerase